MSGLPSSCRFSQLYFGRGLKGWGDLALEPLLHVLIRVLAILLQIMPRLIRGLGGVGKVLGRHGGLELLLGVVDGDVLDEAPHLQLPAQVEEGGELLLHHLHLPQVDEPDQQLQLLVGDVLQVEERVAVRVPHQDVPEERAA